MADKIVRITLNPSGVPQPDQDPVSVRQHNDRIRWCAEFSFDIEILGYADVTYAEGGDCAHSATSGYFNDLRDYKYSITANGHTSDPVISVNPSAAEPRRPPTPPHTPPKLPPDDE